MTPSPETAPRPVGSGQHNEVGVQIDVVEISRAVKRPSFCAVVARPLPCVTSRARNDRADHRFESHHKVAK